MSDSSGREVEQTKDLVLDSEHKDPTYKEIFLSAYIGPALDVWKYGSPILLGAILMAEDDKHKYQREVARNRSLRYHSQYGDWAGKLYINALYVGGFTVAGYYADSLYYDSAKAMFWAYATSGLTTQVLKHLVRQKRPPPDYDFPHINNRDRKSFPSGHTNSAFTFASVVQQFHGWAWGIPAYALATLVGWSRMDDNKHYFHDVVFGATIGITYGIGVSQLYKRDDNGENKHGLALVPEIGGAQIRYTYNF